MALNASCQNHRRNATLHQKYRWYRFTSLEVPRISRLMIVPVTLSGKIFRWTFSRWLAFTNTFPLPPSKSPYN